MSANKVEHHVTSVVQGCAISLFVSIPESVLTYFTYCRFIVCHLFEIVVHQLAQN